MIVKHEKDLLKLPEDVDLIDAAFAHIASFPMLGVRKLRLELGESCMVAGLGLLGLFAVQFAKLSGAYPVLACDYSAERRALALQLGADYALDPQDADFIEQVRALTDGKGPAAIAEMHRILDDEEQNVRETIPLVEYDSRLGWEPTMLYTTDADCLNWKLDQLNDARKDLKSLSK